MSTQEELQILIDSFEIDDEIKEALKVFHISQEFYADILSQFSTPEIITTNSTNLRGNSCHASMD